MSNFVIFSTKEDYYKVIYNDIIGKENVRFIVSPVANRSLFIRALYKVMMSPKLDFIFKRYRYLLNVLYDRQFDNEDRTVYLFFYGRLPWVDNRLLEYLKKKHKDCMTVCYFQDLIAKKNVDIEKVKSQFDVVLDYDEKEANKYNLIYAPTPFSYIKLDGVSNEETDVYFVGKAKERLHEIYEVFDLLTAHGFKCDFYIADVQEKDQIKKTGLHYINKSLSYLENLKKVSKAKIILELMQTGAIGYTLRTWEAIAYNKILLTNNTSLNNTPLVEAYNVLAFDKFDNTAIEKLKTFKKKCYTYKNEFSPTKLLKLIDEYGK